MSRPTSTRRRPGFTLVELLVVIVIIALLLALLVPAIMTAVKTANNARVQAEINAMAQALASFKNKYGDYPPSQIVLVEDGNYSTANLGTFAGLQARSISFIRKFWPQVNISATGATIPTTNTAPGSFFDFNGNGTNDGDTVFVLQGHQCLVYFLGGLPQATDTGGLTMTGFSKNPANPFVNAVSVVNRTPPFYEFNNSRLLADAKSPGAPTFPGYIDSLGSFDPAQPPYFAYFSAYGGQGYDPDDVNFAYGAELAPNGTAILGAFMTTNDAIGTAPVAARTDWFSSPSPNPYVNDLPIPVKAAATPPPAFVSDTTNFKPRAFQNPQSFQIISPGPDRSYGIGGQWTQSGNESLPFTDFQSVNASVTGQTLDNGARQVERDNLTNFKNGTLD